MKIGIELSDSHLSNIDLSNPELGNPGVGGSEYLFDLLASQLQRKNYDITVYHYSNNYLPLGVEEKKVKSNSEVIRCAENDDIDILIYQSGKDDKCYHELTKSNLKAITWSHVYLEYQELVKLRKCTNVKRVVFVGKEEYDSYIDDDIIKRSAYIYNMIPTSLAPQKRELNNPRVTYVGSLVPAKGFHKLAEIWPEVLKRVPNAELNVIGNGKVYNRNAKLGKYGIAQEDYENSFINCLTDENGEILKSVHFLGIVGTEKSDIFSSTTVGVVNPTALTETFCMSAVEMEYAYIPVVSKGKWGLLDTIGNNKSGFLFKTNNEFIDYIVTLLKNTSLNNQMGLYAHEFVKEKFSVDIIIPRWVDLIEQVYNDVPAQYSKVQGNWSNDYKWIKQVIRFFRFTCRLKAVPSFYDIKQYAKRILRK